MPIQWRGDGSGFIVFCLILLALNNTYFKK